MTLALSLLLALGAFEPDPLLPGTPWALKGHTDAITAIAFRPDSQGLASAGRDHTVKLWDLKTGQVTRSITLGPDSLTALAFSADGQRLAVGDLGLQVRVLDTASGEVLKAFAHPDAVGEVALSPDGAQLAVAGLTDTGAVYDWATQKKRFAFRGRTARFSADGQALLVANGAGSFSVLDAKTGKVKKRVDVTPDQPLATWTADGARIATWHLGGIDVRLWSREGKAQATLKGPVAEVERRRAQVTGVALTPDGRRVIVGGADGLVRAWSVAEAKVTQTWLADKNTGVAVSPDGAWLAVTDQGLVKLWKLP